MVRVSLSLITALSVCTAASAGDLLPTGLGEKSGATSRCGALGEGFFPVAGSSACVRISGHVSAGAGFGAGSGAPGALGSPLRGNAANSFNAEAGVAGDLRFDTPAGPARVYVDLRKDTNPAWAVNSQ